MNVTLTMKRFKSMVDPLMPQITKEMEHGRGCDVATLSKVLVIVKTVDTVTDLTFVEMDAYLHAHTGYSLEDMQMQIEMAAQ